ncbi:MAG: TonB-dependent receptor [Acidobacteria bacterium]|nr:TonB-dependent receptor [Acidobacteriota bacterium]
MGLQSFSRIRLLVVFITTLECVGFAQTAQFTGRISDPSGAVVLGAKVTVTNVNTGIKRVTTSTEEGYYTVSLLKPGAYRINVQMAGFKPISRSGISLNANQVYRIDFLLELGELTETIEIRGGAALVETETSRISDRKSADQLKALPQNWFRFVMPFLVLSPNVVQGSDGATRFAGSRINQSHFAIDGTTASDGVGETPIGPLFSYIESVEEFKIDMANNSAEFGPVGQVTVISKSGTNTFHGSAFDHYVTPFFKARNPFAEVRESGISHFPGFSVGGPVYFPRIYNGKGRTFFFTSYETSRGNSTTTFLNPTVPLAAWRQGDFSELSTSLRDPLTDQPFPGNRIPSDRLNPVSLKIQERFYPLPNFGDAAVFSSQNYREAKTRPWDPVSLGTLRLDHHLSDKDSIYGRFSWTRANVRAFDGNLPAIGRLDAVRRTRALTLSHIHHFSPAVLNEFRYGLAYNNFPVHGNIQGKRLVEQLGLVGLAPHLPDISGILEINWAGLGLQSIAQTNFQDPGFRNLLQEFQDHLTWFQGRHNVKFGSALTRVAWSDLAADPNLFGSVTFSDRFTGFAYADFLLGIPTTMARAFPPLRLNRRRNQYDFYVTDELKLTQRLTLNLGVRYELHPYWTERNGLGSVFDVDSGRIVVPQGALSKVSPLLPRDFVDVVEAGKIGLPRHTLLRTDKNNLAPRIGAAYRPWNNNTVFRSGFGIFYDVVPRYHDFGGIPFLLNESAFTNPVVNPTVVFPRVFPASAAADVSRVALPSALNPDLKIPYSLQYNFTIEHSRWNTGFRLSYVGTGTRQGEWSYDINSPLPDERPYIEKPRLFQRYSSIRYLTNGAGHQYHALTAKAERQMIHGLYFQTSWVWARDIGDLGRDEPSENSFDRRRERSVASDVPTHRFNFNFTYQLPFGKSRHYRARGRLLNLFIAGWELTSIFTADTGRFLTPFWCGPDPTGTAFTETRDPAFVCRRPDLLRDPNLAKSQRTIDRFFDTAAFATPPVGRFGTSAKHVIKGPGINVFNASLSKTIPLDDKGSRLRLELMARNLFNHPNYSNPNTDISSVGQAGVISGAYGVHGPDSPLWRLFRAGVRVEW